MEATQTSPRTTISCVHCGSDNCTHVYSDDGYDLVRCEQCALVYVVNPPTPEELAKVYSFAADYHKAFATSDAEREWHFQRARKNYAYMDGVVPLNGERRLLDVGCSAGFFLQVAKEKGWNVRGVEFSADSAELARETFGHQVHNGTLDDFDNGGEPLDCITMWDVIEHVGDPSTTLARAADHLVDRGHLVVTTPNIDGLYPRLSYPIASKINAWRHPEPPMHLFQFSVTTMTAMMEKNGFEVIDVVHEAIPITYSIGGWKGLVRRPWRIPEWLLSAPLIFLGPKIGQGDSICVIARKR